mgnify:CR=1 FL=1
MSDTYDVVTGLRVPTPTKAEPPVLAKVSRRRGKRKPLRVTPAVVDQVATLAAGGVSTRKTAEVLRLSPTTITQVKNREEVRDLITKLRETIRGVALEAISRGQEQAWSWLNEIVEAKDPRAFDYVTRGLSALEKVASSASGEARRIEGTLVGYSAGSKEEARELLQRMLAEDNG